MIENCTRASPPCEVHESATFSFTCQYCEESFIGITDW